LGKSTVVNDWVAAHSGYLREEEPYRALGLHNGIQLYYNISRVHRYATGAADVIFDRAPVDYLAYSQFTADCHTTDIDDEFVASLVPAVRESLDHLDILAFVPGSEVWPVEMEADGILPVDLGAAGTATGGDRPTRWCLTGLSGCRCAKADRRATSRFARPRCRFRPLRARPYPLRSSPGRA
jgi:hypothetical protein